METMKTFIEKYLVPQDKWQNYGDVNYVEYGGIQLRYLGSSIDIVELITPDSHGEDFFLLSSGWLSLSDIVLNYSEDMDIASVKINSEKMEGIISFIGIEKYIEDFYKSYDPKSLKYIIDSICCGAISYGLTGDVDREWHFKNYEDEVKEDDSIENYMLEVVEKDLQKMGLDIN